MDAFGRWLSKQSPSEDGTWVIHIEFCVSAAAWDAAIAAAAPAGDLDSTVDALSRLEREAAKAAYRWYRGSRSQQFSVHFPVGDESREVHLQTRAVADASGRARIMVELRNEPVPTARRPRRR